MTFTNEGINRIIDGDTTHFPWNEFEKMNEDESHYFLYVDDLNGLIIPKQPTVEGSDENAFQQAFITYVHNIDAEEEGSEEITDN